MDKIKILVVDDESRMRKLVHDFLTREGYAVVEAADGEEALDIFYSDKEISLIVLDVMMPKINGWEVCREIRKISKLPIIMLTAKGEDMDKILGLEYGADDYMTKPFNILEVKARIKTILRRTGGAKETPKLVLESRGLEINLGSRSVTVRGVPVNLTVKEFDLLQLFMNNPGKVYSREDLLDRVWGVDYVGDFRTVDVHIRRLREKIESDPANPEYIMTKWGVGYYFA